MISKGGIIIQVDGMAYSSKEVILVERKSAFTFDYVDEVGLKETNLRSVGEGGPLGLRQDVWVHHVVVRLLPVGCMQTTLQNYGCRMRWTWVACA